MAAEAVAPPPLPAPIFGTMEGDDPSAVYENVLKALRAGYRHFDLAEHYKTQGHVGRAIEEESVPRRELFLTSKVDGLPLGDYEQVEQRVRGMLDAVGVEQFDLLLIHYPLPGGTDLSGDPDALAPAETFTWFTESIRAAWANMSRLRAEGLTREVGVSNFYTQHLDVLLALIEEEAADAAEGADAVAVGSGDEHAEPPLVTPGLAAGGLAPVAVAQNFIDAAHPEHELVSACQARGIRVMAYRPLAFLPMLDILEGGFGEALDEKAAALGADSRAQLVLAWLLSRGVSPITSSASEEHMTSNIRAAGALRRSSDAGEGSPEPAGLEGEEGAAADVLPSAVEELFGAIAEQGEMVSMMGGSDEYAAAFKRHGM